MFKKILTLLILVLLIASIWYLVANNESAPERSPGLVQPSGSNYQEPPIDKKKVTMRQLDSTSAANNRKFTEGNLAKDSTTFRDTTNNNEQQSNEGKERKNAQ